MLKISFSDMKSMLFVGMLCVFAMPSMAWAQELEEEEDDIFVIGRPECNHTVFVDGNETSPVLRVRKVGVPGKGLPIVGTPKIPIVLVEFVDRPFAAAGKTGEAVRAKYDLFFNGFDDAEVLAATGSRGSVFSYFESMSHGQFLPEFDIIGPIQLENGYAHYGSNSPGRGKDININAFYQEAVAKAVKGFNVDWSQYDNNKDGAVDIVYFVHAGWGENILSYKDADGNQQNMDPDAIWAKEGTSSVTVTTDDGQSVKFACYGVSAEARYISGNQMTADAAGEFAPTGYNPDNMRMDGIGVCIHEISHALGLPDFYDLSYTNYGMDVWSVMDYGEYANNGYNPGCYNAYERNFMGWEELPVLDKPQVVTLPCFADGGHGYKMVNPANKDEYYVLENRQPKGWDDMAGKYGSGLLVIHVDYLASKWTGNKVNTLSSTTDHQRMTIISANNEYKTRDKDGTAAWRESQAGVCFPGNQFKYDFTDDTDPAARVYSGKNAYSGFMNQPLRNITQHEDGTITLCYMTNGQLDTPEELRTQEVAIDRFSVAWDEVEHAIRYAVEMEDEFGAQIKDTVQTCQFAREGLHPNSAVRVRVQALADSPEDYVESEWSEYLEFYTDVDCISTLPDSEKEVTVYTLNGMAVSQCMADEVCRMSLRPGIYVVRYANGSSRKVMLK